MWNIEFFRKNNGRCPSEEFLEELSPKKDLPYIRKRFDQLEEHGIKLERPLAAHLMDGIYELRLKTINGQFRFFYFFFDGQNIVITHGRKKKDVSGEDINLAKEYRTIYFARHGKKK
jgi:phage-related protein